MITLVDQGERVSRNPDLHPEDEVDLLDPDPGRSCPGIGRRLLRLEQTRLKCCSPQETISYRYLLIHFVFLALHLIYTYDHIKGFEPSIAIFVTFDTFQDHSCFHY